MAGYTRQSSAQIVSGEVISASPINAEYNQLLAAFNETSGHAHDGTAAEGPPIDRIADADQKNAVLIDTSNNHIEFYNEVGGAATQQLRIQDGAVIPITNNDIDLGHTSNQFKDLFLDGTAKVDTLTVDDNATVAGTLGVTGALTGSSTLQGTTITATTAFVPDASDGAALGTSSLEFSDLFLADEAVINLGDDQDVTLTHVHNTGVLLNSTNQLQFGDSGTYIHQSADGVLDLVADTEIEINATTVDINGAVEISGNATVGGTLIPTGKITADAGIDIDNFNIDGTTIALSSGDMLLDSAGDVILDADGADVLLKDDGTQYGALTNNSGNLIIKSGSTTAATFTGANTALAGTLSATALSVGDGNITNVGDIALDSISADDTDINVAVTDNSATAFTIKQGSDAYLVVDTANSSESVSIGTGVSGTAVTIGHGTSEVTIGDNLTVTGNLTVSGTQTVVDTVTMNAENAVVFEGATADAHETTLTIVDPTADRTINLPNQSGTLPVLAAVSATQVSATPEELNIMDGDTSASSTTIADADRVVVNDAGTMKQVAVTDLAAYFDDEITAMPNLVSTGALDSGSITSGFGTINTGSSAITTTGAVNFGSLNDGSIGITAFVDEDNMSSNSATLVPTQQSVKAYVDTVSGTSNNVTGLTASGAELNVLDGASAGTIVNSKGVIYSSGGKVNATSLQIAGTDLTATATEFNLLDGDSTVGTTAVASGDGILTNDNGTMRQTSLDTFDTYLSASSKTLTNKTLTEPKIADGGFIADANGAEMVVFQTVSSAANALEVTNGAASGAVVIGTMGSDSNVSLNITPKGSGEVTVSSDMTIVDDKKLYFGTNQDTYLEYDEDGTDKLIIKGNTTFLDGAYDFDIASHDTINGLKLGGTLVTATAAELNFVDGVTSNIQTQLNARASTGKAIAMAMVFG